MNTEWELRLDLEASEVQGRGGPGSGVSPAWVDWLWSQDWWPPGCWWNGRVWRWKERCVGWARLPLRPGGWGTDPFLRRPCEWLPGLLVLLAMTVALRLLLLLLAFPVEGA